MNLEVPEPIKINRTTFGKRQKGKRNQNLQQAINRLDTIGNSGPVICCTDAQISLSIFFLSRAIALRSTGIHFSNPKSYFLFYEQCVK